MTLKQKRAVQKIVENGGNITKAMRESGYRPASLNNPKSLTESKGFKELAAKFLPDEKLFSRHAEGLDATKTISANIIVVKSDDPTVKEKQAHSRTMDFIDVPDFHERREYIELGYKLKGYLHEGGPGFGLTAINISFSPDMLSDEEKTYIENLKQLPPEILHEVASGRTNSGRGNTDDHPKCRRKEKKR